MKSVEIITTVLKKEADAIEGLKKIKEDYKKLQKEKKIDEILYKHRGWTPPPTTKPFAKVASEWNPSSVFGDTSNSAVDSDDGVFETVSKNAVSEVSIEETTTTTTITYLPTTTTSTTTSTSTTKRTTTSVTITTTTTATSKTTKTTKSTTTSMTPTTTVKTITTTTSTTPYETTEASEIFEDDRFDFDETLFANDFVASENFEARDCNSQIISIRFFLKTKL